MTQSLRVTDMQEIEVLRARLAAAERLADTLAVVWDAFSFIQAVADNCAEFEPGMFAAFMFAAASAVGGRDALGFAPSMPSSLGVPSDPAGPDAADPYEFADGLAGLASALRTRLRAAAAQAQDPGDRRACERAACEAGHVSDLLGLDQ